VAHTREICSLGCLCAVKGKKKSTHTHTHTSEINVKENSGKTVRECRGEEQMGIGVSARYGRREEGEESFSVGKEDQNHHHTHTHTKKITD
jgi:hypothetical protein